MIIAIDTNCILPGRVGGLESYVLTLVRCLRDHAKWVERLILLTRPENEQLFDTFASPRCRVLPVPRPAPTGCSTANWSALARAAPDAAAKALRIHQQHKLRLIHECGADVVHFPGNTINPFDLDVPAVLNLHDLQHRHLPQYFTHEELAHREQWWSASALRADALVTTSNFVANDVHRELGVPRERIFVAPLPVDDYFISSHARPAAPRPLSFLYPAALWPHKNHDRLIRAFLSAGLDDANLILTGFDPGNAQSLNRAGPVRLLGRVGRSTLRALYSSATAMIFPSEYEASSFPVLEAMASGCPIAASNIPSLRDLIGDAGLLFDPHDEALMAQAMRRMATDAELRRELAHRGRQRVAEFTPDAFLRGLRAAYDHALQRRRQRAA